MRLIYAQRSITPNVSFEFLNRQLVWEAFTEFILFLMPLVNVNRLRSRLARTLSTSTTKYKSLSLIVSALPTPIAKALRITPRERLANSTAPKAVQQDPTVRPQGPLYFLPDTVCPICYSLSTAPPTSIPSDPTSRDPDRISLSVADASLASSDQDTSVKIPYVTDCGWSCRYCYYCVVGKLAAVEEEGDDKWDCLRCGGEVHGVRREVVDSADPAMEDADSDSSDHADDGEDAGGPDEDVEEKDAPPNNMEKNDERTAHQEKVEVGPEHEIWRD